MKPIKILLLDDEISILNSLRRVLSRQGFDVNIFSNPHEALEFLKENKDLQIIVSDMRMPEMSGSEFLEKACEINDLPVRIVLSGYSERENLLHAINQGKIWCFLPKPWDNADLIQTLLNAAKVYDHQSEKDKLLKELEKKSQDLEKLNDHLETIVESRTHELNSRSKLLEKLIDCEDHQTVLKETTDIIDHLSGKPGHKIESLSGSTSYPENSYPLSKGGTPIGYISIEGGVADDSDHDHLLQRFAPIAILALKQISIEKDSEDFIKDVESWLEVD